MAKLTSSERNSLPSSDFVFPKQRKFPIEDAAHARDALSRAGAKGGSVQSKVRSAVGRKFPGIGKKPVVAKIKNKAHGALYGE